MPENQYATLINPYLAALQERIKLDLVFTRARASTLYDARGRSYFDAAAPQPLGHQAATLTTVAQRLRRPQHPLSVTTDRAGALAKRLLDLAPLACAWQHWQRRPLKPTQRPCGWPGPAPDVALSSSLIHTLSRRLGR